MKKKERQPPKNKNQKKKPEIFKKQNEGNGYDMSSQQVLGMC